MSNFEKNSDEKLSIDTSTHIDRIVSVLLSRLPFAVALYIEHTYSMASERSEAE